MSRRFLGAFLASVTLLLPACSGDAMMPASMDGTALETVSPMGGTVAVSVGSTVVVTFSHSMMPGMEMLAALHEGTVAGPVVAGEWAWSADRTRLTFTPAQPLKPGTAYTLHLGGGMRDARGRIVDMQRHGGHMGGMMQGGMMGGGSHMGPGWRHANGSYGMVFPFTTAS